MTYLPTSPRVISVQPLDGYRLALTFKNGEQGIFDCSEYLDFGVFKELRDEVYFRRVGLWEEVGTIRWPHGQDLCPDSLYVGSQKNALKESDR
jgi:Protein of unknown function (DUF2442)